jgi:hypothetical protein
MDKKRPKGKNAGHTGPIHAHRMPKTGGGGGFDASHGKQNKAHGLPPDVYGHAGEGYQEGTEGDNEECC